MALRQAEARLDLARARAACRSRATCAGADRCARSSVVAVQEIEQLEHRRCAVAQAQRTPGGRGRRARAPQLSSAHASCAPYAGSVARAARGRGHAPRSCSRRRSCRAAGERRARGARVDPGEPDRAGARRAIRRRVRIEGIVGADRDARSSAVSDAIDPATRTYLGADAGRRTRITRSRPASSRWSRSSRSGQARTVLGVPRAADPRRGRTQRACSSCATGAPTPVPIEIGARRRDGGRGARGRASVGDAR